MTQPYNVTICNDKALQCHIPAMFMSQPCNDTALQCHSPAMSQPCNVTALQCHSPAMSQAHSPTMSQAHSPTMSQPYNVTAPQCHIPVYRQYTGAEGLASSALSLPKCFWARPVRAWWSTSPAAASTMWGAQKVLLR